MSRYSAAIMVASLMFVGGAGFAAEGDKDKDKPKPAEAPLDDAAAKKAFEEDYEAGSSAAADKKWDVAVKKLTDALKALGERAHVNKSTATVLLSKAQKALYKDDAMNTANELKRLKQWAEAEEAYRLVINVTGETESLKKSIADCRVALELESPELKKANELYKAKKWQESIDAYNTAAEKLGTLRPIREGLNDAKVNIEAEGLMKKATDALMKKDWEAAFDTYQKVAKMIGENDEVKKGIAAAQAGYAEEHKGEKKQP
ncbi:MAG TPA: hypothetical protein VKX17_25055 [Planctomycetota bacterium]|nr:hypothetical protein [Planctomycetota bacterium]